MNRNSEDPSADEPAAVEPAAEEPTAEEPAHERARALHDSGEPRDPARSQSYGNMSERHWSRARAGTNEEALQYYRQRSRAPGVESGGAERNFYCMRCDGVIPHGPARDRCPHCGEALTGAARRYFNWVEINEPPPSDARALLPFFAGGLLILLGVGALLWWWIS